MLGWFKADAARASFSKRFNREGSAETSAGRTLIATSRARRVSRARQTSPIPPAPSGPSVSYGPSRTPVARLKRNPSERDLDRGAEEPRVLARLDLAVVGIVRRDGRVVEVVGIADRLSDRVVDVLLRAGLVVEEVEEIGLGRD